MHGFPAKSTLCVHCAPCVTPSLPMLLFGRPHPADVSSVCTRPRAMQLPASPPATPRPDPSHLGYIVTEDERQVRYTRKRQGTPLCTTISLITGLAGYAIFLYLTAGVALSSAPDVFCGLFFFWVWCVGRTLYVMFATETVVLDPQNVTYRRDFCIELHARRIPIDEVLAVAEVDEQICLETTGRNATIFSGPPLSPRQRSYLKHQLTQHLHQMWGRELTDDVPSKTAPETPLVPTDCPQKPHDSLWSVNPNLRNTLEFHQKWNFDVTGTLQLSAVVAVTAFMLSLEIWLAKRPHGHCTMAHIFDCDVFWRGMFMTILGLGLVVFSALLLRGLLSPFHETILSVDSTALTIETVRPLWGATRHRETGLRDFRVTPCKHPVPATEGRRCEILFYATDGRVLHVVRALSVGEARWMAHEMTKFGHRLSGHSLGV